MLPNTATATKEPLQGTGLDGHGAVCTAPHSFDPHAATAAPPDEGLLMWGFELEKWAPCLGILLFLMVSEDLNASRWVMNVELHERL